jgi:pectin methylesterase-like acyl-CoA thioesterase
MTWSGASGTDTNWSTAGNWFGGVPGATDDVKFFDFGTNGALGVANSFANPAFAGSIGTLQLGQTNGLHTIALADGTALNISGGNLVVGTPADVGAARNLTNYITGLNASLNVSNAAAQIAIQQGTAVNVSGTRGNLNLAGLGNFNAHVSRLGLGSTVFQNPGNAAQREAGALFLARTNLIVLGYTDTLANYQTAGKTNALELSRNPGNNAGSLSLLVLGQTNAFFLDSLGVGRDKASASAAAWMGFNPAFLASNPSAYFRGVGGPASRVTWWAIGDMNANASSAQVAVGTNDFTGGTVDALVDVLSLGRDCSPNHTATASIIGVFTMTAGLLDVNTIYAGNQSLGPNTSSAPNLGFLNINGGTLRVNSSLVLGRTVQTAGTGAATFSTRGVLNVRNGAIAASGISAGTLSTNNTITLTNGTLTVTNTVGTLVKGITTVTATNSTFQLVINGANSPNVVTTNLITGGTINVMNILAIPVFATYPTQFTLVEYVGAIGGAGYNFGLGSVPGAAPGAYLSNNTLNASIDLVLPVDPKPAITSLPGSYGGSPGDNVSFAATYSGSAPLSVFWLKDGTNVVNDGPTGSGATITGAASGTLNIAGAQAAESGSYALVVSNPYGVVTSSPPASLIISTNDIAPIINGPNSLTVVQGNTATFTTSVSGKPVPAVQWYQDGVELPAETSPNLALVNVQYPAAQGTYSIVASNVAGLTTNSASLTVIVPPVIAVQPVSLAVTNTQAAAFTVVSTNGVPGVTYQWKKNGGNLANATNATLSFASVTPADMGSYTVFIANAAGSVLSTAATLTVNSTMTVTSLTPSNGATGVFYDTPLTLTFSVAPTLRAAGTIKIYNLANPATPVDTIDLGLGAVQNRFFPNDSQAITYEYVTVSGNTAKIFPRFNVLTSNQTYFVTVDNGVFADAAGAYFVGVTDSATWQFTTKPSGPADPDQLLVAADGSGDFLTVQGAVNAIPANNLTPRVINIRNGDYNELVNIATRHNVLFRGESREGVILGCRNNNTFQGANAGTRSRMAFKVAANDVAIESLTLTNRTPAGGSQAEALFVESNARRFVFQSATLASYQDTLLVNENSSEAYFYNSRIQGQFDFIWGGGRVFFTNCEIRTLTGSGGSVSGGNVTAARTGAGNTNGFSFMRCQFTRLNGNITNTTLAGANGNAGGNAAFISCNFDYNYTNPAAAVIASQILWEYGNSNLDNTLPRAFGLTVLPDGDGRLVAAQTARIWLNGWAPELPYLVVPPTSRSVAVGGTTNFTVAASAFSAPTLQWQRYGTNIPGATNVTLVITGASASDAGEYSLIAANAGGSVTNTVTLTVGITAPVLPPVGDFTVNVGAPVSFTNNASDTDLPPQTLTYSLLSGPAGATLGATSGVFSFRPTLAQAASSNFVSLKVADNAVPSLSATQSFSIFVNPLGPVALEAGSYTGGLFTASVTGDTGPDYAIRASTNLVNWETIFTTNSPAMPFTWADPNAPLHPFRFYQVLVGPPLP